MKLIKEIRIHRFRSFGDAVIKTEDLNIFSGVNNVGKSNVLKALDLFFNYEKKPYDYDRDYNKAYTESATGARSVIISITFFAQGGTGMLRKEFSIIREFTYGSTTPITTYTSKDADIQKKINKKNNGQYINQFTRFLNTIQFFYIPAIRDKDFVKRFLANFELVIKQSPKSAEFDENIANLSNILSEHSRDVSKEFESFLQLPTRAQLSSNKEDILGSLGIKVDSGIRVAKKRMNREAPLYIVKKSIDIFSSGDGILMSYLVYFLDFICQMNTKKRCIWGYEEPENSLEYSKIQSLAKMFYDKFNKNSQIFLTTHSPAFIKLKDLPNVMLYRVYVDLPEIDQNKPDKRLSRVVSLKDLKRQMNLFNDENAEEYKKLEQELYMVEFSSEIEETVKELQRQRELLSKTNKNVVILTEGDTDKIIISKAYSVLRGNEMPFDIVSFGSCNTLNNVICGISDDRNKRYIAIFDADDAGKNNINGIAQKKNYDGTLMFSNENDILRKGNNFAIMLPVPDAKKFMRDNPSGFEIEDYFPENVFPRNRTTTESRFVVIDGTQTYEKKTYYKIADRAKTNFANSIVNMDNTDHKFDDFEILISTIEDIMAMR